MSNYNRPLNNSTDTCGRIYQRRDNEFLGNDNVESLQYDNYGAGYPIGDSQEVKRESEYMTNKEYQQCVTNSNLYNRMKANASAVRSNLNADIRTQQGCYQQYRRVPLLQFPKRTPQYYGHCTNERGDYGHTVVETNKNPFESNDHQFSPAPCQHVMSTLNRERSNQLKQAKVPEKLGNRISEFHGKSKVSDDEIKETSIKNLQEGFIRKNLINERKNLEEQKMKKCSYLRNAHLLCNRNREKSKQSKLISNENIMSINRTIPNPVETKCEPTDNIKLQPRVNPKDKYPTSFMYELATGKSTLAATNINQSVENDPSLLNDSEDKGKDDGGVNNELPNTDDEVSLSQATHVVKDKDNEKMYFETDNYDILSVLKNNTRSRAKSIHSYRSNISSKSKIANILKSNTSKCSFISVINDGQKKAEKKYVKSDVSSELKLLQNDEKFNKDDSKLPVKQSQLIQVDSPSSEEKFCLDIMKSEIMSKMFKSVRDYHLKNIVQEVERLKYLDKLPEELVERKT